MDLTRHSFKAMRLRDASTSPPGGEQPPSGGDAFLKDLDTAELATSSA